MLKSIQLLRGVAAWMVVFHHVMQIFFRYKGDGWLASLFSHYGAVGVDIFFVVSGFVIYNSTIVKSASPLHFFAYRLIRIVPLYWIFTLLTALLVVNFKGLIPLTRFSPEFLIQSLLFIPSLNPSGIGFIPIITIGWTLNYEMVFYFVFSFALIAPEQYRWFYVVIGIAILQAILPIFSNVFDFYSNKIVYEFLYGVLVGVFYSRKWLEKINFPMALAILCIAISVIAFSYTSHLDKSIPATIPHSGSYLSTGISCALIVVALLSLENYLPQINPLIQLGNWSYSTYLSHIIILSISYRAMTVWNINPYVTIFIACMAILIISYLSFVIIEKQLSFALKHKLAYLIHKSRMDKMKH